MMNRFFFILCIIIFSQCSENVKQNEKSTNCENSRFYGKIEVCLPEIDGMRECMTHPKLKGRPGILVSEQNTTLGIYINDSSINQLEASQTPENIGLNGYFKVYGIGKMEGMQIGQSEFDAFAETFKNQFVHNDWNIVKMEISMLNLEKEMNNFRAKAGKPILHISNSFDKQVEILNYKPNEQIVTSVLILLSSTDENKALVNTMSIVRVLDTILFYSYYQTYKDENTIEQVKNQNDIFGMALLKINN
ncbi:MAG: hypothetical protein RLZ10_2510 [Bacteroidota bacterium]